MHSRLCTGLCALTLLFSFAACDSTSSDPSGDAPRAVVLAAPDLPALQSGAHYEGWAALANGSIISTGKFNSDGEGRFVTLDGETIEAGRFEVEQDLSSATTIVVTIEPAGDANATPSPTKVLAGTLSGGEASLTLGHPDAAGESFSAASGSFILATPTDDDPDNETSGVWFASLEGGAPVPALALPEAPAGWAYEGWVVIDGNPLSTGVFRRPDEADDAVAFYGGGGPPIPGEDFLQNAPAGLAFPVDLAGSFVAITLEPAQDDSPMPFPIIPLSTTVPTPSEDRVDYALDNVAVDIPRGTARVE